MEAFGGNGGVVEAGGHVGDVMVIGAEAQGHFCARGDGAKGHAVEGVMGVVTQAEIFDVVVVVVTGRIYGDRGHVWGGVERKGNANGVVRHVEGDIRAVERAARAVVFSPGFVDSHFGFIAAGAVAMRLFWLSVTQWVWWL